MSPEVGQAVLACPPVLAEPSPLPKQDRGQASTACPTEQGIGLAHFPGLPGIAGRRGFRIVGEIDLSHDVARTLVSAADAAREEGRDESLDS